ncbi:hypothetical protein P4O66_004161 [Electrophorus voltai]|uniref:Uncharacterized protein n=1 Tax=Electrophorus voltai TaxID=2609070 RepID=A0AAD8ZQU8_9TELE|nr:hypothetical protein P4O66_004161 [Electrophorus voltai]
MISFSVRRHGFAQHASPAPPTKASGGGGAFGWHVCSVLTRASLVSVKLAIPFQTNRQYSSHAGSTQRGEASPPSAGCSPAVITPEWDLILPPLSYRFANREQLFKTTTGVTQSNAADSTCQCHWTAIVSTMDSICQDHGQHLPGPRTAPARTTGSVCQDRRQRLPGPPTASARTTDSVCQDHGQRLWPLFFISLSAQNYTLPNLNYTLPYLNYTLPNLNYTLPYLNYTLPNLNYTLPPNLDSISPRGCPDYVLLCKTMTERDKERETSILSKYSSLGVCYMLFEPQYRYGLTGKWPQSQAVPVQKHLPEVLMPCNVTPKVLKHTDLMGDSKKKRGQGPQALLPAAEPPGAPGSATGNPDSSGSWMVSGACGCRAIEEPQTVDERRYVTLPWWRRSHFAARSPGGRQARQRRGRALRCYHSASAALAVCQCRERRSGYGPI